MTELLNDARKRLGIKGGASIEESIRNYDKFDLDDYGNLTFTYKKYSYKFWEYERGSNTTFTN